MRVLVHGLVGTNLGGIETFLLNMNDKMSDDCIFDYVIEEERCIHKERIKKKGGKVYKVRSRARSPFGHIADIYKIYKKHKGDYPVIYYNLSSLSWLLPEMLAGIMGYKVVVHSHNAMLIDKNSGFLHRSMNKINKIILGHMKVTRLACSKYAADFMFGKRSAEIIYNGISVEDYKFSPRSRKLNREKYQLGEDFVIGVVGRLAYQKNPLFSIEIFREIYLKNKNTKLVFVGDGPLAEEMKKTIAEYGLQENVVFTGIINDVASIVNAFDVFLLPSRHEGLGIALIEAQANGLPCYTSKNVVPEEAKVTELFHSIDLEDPPNKWAKFIYKEKNKTLDESKRKEYNNMVSAAEYDISPNAGRLEKILIEKCAKPV